MTSNSSIKTLIQNFNEWKEFLESPNPNLFIKMNESKRKVFYFENNLN